MERKDKIKIDSLSKIDDDIIEKVAVKRFELLGKLQGKVKKVWTKKQKMWFFGGGGVAAAVLLAFLGVFLFSIFFKQVPIYTGMTVSHVNANENAGLSNLLEEGKYLYLDASKENNGNHNGQNKNDEAQQPEMEEAVKDSLVVEGAEKTMYYASAGEDIFITIHIDNPDAFEIVSFTLNGQKYTNYMFEDGSDLENLILKVNVGEDAINVLDYTIDAIKYIDGTEIKDVKMEGDKTVRVGIKGTEQPTVTVENMTAGFDVITMDVTVNDPQDLIKKTYGKAVVGVYDGNNKPIYQVLRTNETTKVRLEGLTRNTAYEFAVVLAYDDLSGDGFLNHFYAYQTIHTESFFAFGDPQVGNMWISFTPEWHESVKTQTLKSLAVYQNGEKIKDCPLDATVIDGLLEDTAYTLVATVEVDGEEDRIVYDFKTTLTSYTVIYRFETLDGSEKIKTKIEYGKAGETVIAPVSDVYKYLYVLPERELSGVITADGKLTFEYYYPLREFEIKFVSNGGEDIERGGYKYGQTLPVPVREGYTFGGWGDNVSLYWCTKEMVWTEDTTAYAYWEEETKPELLSYETNGDRNGKYMTVTGLRNYSYGNAAEEVVIPAYIGGVPVTELKLYGGDTIPRLVLGENIKTIRQDSFGNGAKIRTLVIPATVETIAAGAFDQCDDLWEVYNLSACELGFEPLFLHDSLDDTGAVFTENNGYTTTSCNGKVYLIDVNGYQIPDWTAKDDSETIYYEIAPRVFGHVGYSYPAYEEWTELTLFDCVTGVGDEAFSGLTELKHLSVGKNVTKIGRGAFGTCEKLLIVTFASPENWVEVKYNENGTTTETPMNFANMTAEEIGDYFYETCKDDPMAYSWYVKNY